MLALGVPALRICACSLVFGGMTVIFSSSYQSLGYSGLTLLVSACRQMLFPLPLAWLLSRTGVLERVWLAIPVIALLSYLCCIITTKLLSFLPGSRYFIGY